MNELYPVLHWPSFEIESEVICICKTRADAEEMILSLTEGQSYEDYLDCIYSDGFPHDIQYYLYDPLKENQLDYFIGAPMKVVP